MTENERFSKALDLLLQAQAGGVDVPSDLLNVLSNFVNEEETVEYSLDEVEYTSFELSNGKEKDGTLLKNTPPPTRGTSKKDRKQLKKKRAIKRKIEEIRRGQDIKKSLHNVFSLKTQEPWSVVDINGKKVTAQQIPFINDILDMPWGLKGRGQPEILKRYKKSHGLTIYTRHISHRDRLVYTLNPQNRTIVILSQQGHYGSDFNLGQLVTKHINSSLFTSRQQ